MNAYEFIVVGQVSFGDIVAAHCNDIKHKNTSCIWKLKFETSSNTKENNTNNECIVNNSMDFKDSTCYLGCIERW